MMSGSGYWTGSGRDQSRGAGTGETGRGRRRRLGDHGRHGRRSKGRREECPAVQPAGLSVGHVRVVMSRMYTPADGRGSILCGALAPLRARGHGGRERTRRGRSDGTATDASIGVGSRRWLRNGLGRWDLRARLPLRCSAIPICCVDADLRAFQSTSAIRPVPVDLVRSRRQEAERDREHGGLRERWSCLPTAPRLRWRFSTIWSAAFAISG